MGKTIAINAGSSTLKFKLFEMPEERVISSGTVDRIGISGSNFTIKTTDGKKVEIDQPIKNHEEAVNLLLKELLKLDIIKDYSEITGVGHRVVAGGEIFQDSALIDDKVLKQIEDLKEYAPLHNPANATGIRAFKKVLPDITSVAVFDTSFHETLPEKNYLYSIPYEYYEKYGARKYGAHGTSHQYVAGRAAKMMGKPLEELKIITLHLGAGSSITAIKDGKSFDTSMGFTPLAGITMATRSGDIDASLVVYLMQKLNITNPEDILTILNKKSGLLGLSGMSPDLRDIIDAAEKGEHRAQMAIDIFVNNIVKYIGSYATEMGGLDGIVFTAGIGENSVPMREKITSELGIFNVKLDQALNEKRGERFISAEDSAVQVMVIPTDEELAIARDVEKFKKMGD
ncbi:MAG: acetate kinase [Pediococcus pentosaceus]|uniref:acetate/propionate family kinase n=1 Tax=Pediococcus pentosaceus TaxID=1255 RepID=UPI001918B386|nr:acetate kinase [Pediococcus pentosaceus]MCH4015686.1 acetate kinase [Pediococcus pentosaceus]MCT3025746.1 acetate kinase [Pediococcus pentosaceus]MDD1390040.1 acetate kinase [Pediococcus pentosaceus]MDV6380153.1 acetate kinase [Pediococcus pentosaceus]QQT96923.1 acetate kinase [Pediococcus pentosaceus]